MRGLSGADDGRGCEDELVCVEGGGICTKIGGIKLRRCIFRFLYMLPVTRIPVSFEFRRGLTVLLKVQKFGH